MQELANRPNNLRDFTCMGRTEKENMLKMKDRERKKQKKQEDRATEALNSYSMHSTAEDHTELRKKKKKKKKKHEGSDVGKRGKKKHEGTASEESNNCSDVLYSIMEGGTGMRKEGSKKKKKKMKTMNKEDVVCNDLGFDATLNEALNVMDNVGWVNSNKENDQKRIKSELKRDRKEHENGLMKHGSVGGEGIDIKEFSDDKFHDGKEKKRSSQLNEGKDVGSDFELTVRNDKKRSHVDNSGRDVGDSISSSMEISKKNKKGKDKVVMGHKFNETEDIAEVKDGEEGNRTKKIKKRKRDEGHGNVEGKDNNVNAKGIGKERVQSNSKIMEKVKHGKQEKKGKKRKDNNGLEMEARIVGTEDENKRKRKKVKLAKNILSEEPESEVEPTTKENTESSNLSEKSKPDSTPRRVRFSDHVEVFPPSNAEEGLVQGAERQKGMVHGKRFSREEDEMVKEAVLRYIEDHDLGEEGLNKVLNCGSYREVRGCWKEIAAALPWRPHESVYHRGHILFEKAEKRAWSTEEYGLIRRFHEQHGSDWTVLAKGLGKHRHHVKDAWRRIRLANVKKGHWSQDEYQSLFDLVNTDLRMKAFEEKKCKHGMLRDNISWEAISDRFSTRISSSCCLKWYGQLSSPMVAEGQWADSDDYRLVDALFNLDACCMEDVDWDSLIEHRSGELCRKRWNQMIRHVGEYKNKSFAEQVELLSNRYLPDLIEARQAYEDKVAVD